tara:strand:- start:467 stop:580 length:114 start_codon:yes stop_codon:yes gene_type:complete
MKKDKTKNKPTKLVKYIYKPVPKRSFEEYLEIYKDFI